MIRLQCFGLLGTAINAVTDASVTFKLEIVLVGAQA